MAGRQEQYHLGPKIRAAFCRSLEILEDRTHMTLPEIMYNEIAEHGLLHVMDKVAKYMEKTSEVSVTAGDSLLGVLTTIADESSRLNSELEDESNEVRH